MLNRVSVEPLTITDLEIDPEDKSELRTIELQFNPETLSRDLTARYGSHAPIGFTGTTEHFVGNSNTELAIELFYSATWAAEYQILTNARNFLESLLRPSNRATTIQTNAPPKILVVWPNNLALQCRAKSLRITDELYDPDGRVLQFSGTLTLFEVVEQRITKERTKLVGPQRGPAIVI